MKFKIYIWRAESPFNGYRVSINRFYENRLFFHEKEIMSYISYVSDIYQEVGLKLYSYIAKEKKIQKIEELLDKHSD